MNKTFKLVAIIVAGLMLVTISSEAQGRVATVDVAKVFGGYWKRQKAMEVLGERKADLEKELDVMKKGLVKLDEEFKKLAAASEDQALSSEEREKRKKEAIAKQKELEASKQEIDAFVKTNTGKLEQQSKRSIEEMLKEIREVVQSRARTSGYSLVINRSGESAQGLPLVLYSADDSDITDAVLKQLNSTAPADFKPSNP